ncbi:hypothetical protein [Magnetospirillum aberrantis]|uniref:Uncharacterized protein n=1 Tax=Magnetospirillum aberrantis SpK TaxID=908842 RepID=A0A7C9UVH7_9PROT|nr:hypothetical protein [Magnetospirillum aberrantis]NFV81428.1 hypothetical protein [Magnetospirillum aberrantis SpK]
MRHAAILAAALCLSAPASTMAQIQYGERLLMGAPAGWSTVPIQRGEKMVITRLFPPGEGETQWTQAITVQMYPNSDQSARAFIESIIAYSRDNCEAVGPGPVSETQNNGYPSATVTVTCTKGRASGMGSFALIQVIRGREGLYAVQRQWRGPAFGRDQNPAFPPDMLKEWGEFARTVSLCDTRNRQHPCP